MKLLKFVTPFVAPWLGIMDDTYAKQIANEIKLTGEIVKVLPSIAEGPDLKIADRMDRSMEPEPIQGAPLRTLRMMLEEKDPQQVWGGLERVLTPEGHYLWLCKYHAEKYKD